MPTPEEIEALQRRISELELTIQQMEQVGAAYIQDRENEQRASQLNIQLQGELRQALKSNRRQLEEIAKAHARFLPTSYPMVGGIEVSAHCRPCADVGGDFYDMFELADGRIAICMADVSGHGAMASMSMATSRALLRTALLEAEPYHNPSDILLRLSYWLGHQFDVEQFVTMWLGIYDPATNILSASSAAHPAAILWPHEGEPEFVKLESGLPLGLAGIAPQPYPEVEVTLQPGDRVFLYTDGWCETPTREGKVLEGEVFLDFLSNAYGQPILQVPTVLFMLFERHAAGSRIRDDVSLLVFDRAE
ncbi:MAG: SpoIIE family protein phosphatase [Candidatus Sumerlaeia bacterium]|nr:SpoIIE family protein phosphatase [Candidatus Sumerlaeia bacterium]